MLMHFSLRCIQVIAGVLGRAGETGQKQRLAAAAQGNITYQPAQGLIMADGDKDGDKTDAGKILSGSTSRMGEGVPRERVDETTETIDTGLGNAEEMANKMDEVSNHESHRTKGGRDIKATS